MKISLRALVCFLGLLSAVHAHGGGTSGGSGLGKTIAMLQQVPFEKVIVTVEEVTSIPESHSLPRLTIPLAEYDDLLAEAEKVLHSEGDKPFVLEVPLEGGKSRYYELEWSAEAETKIIYLVERTPSY